MNARVQRSTRKTLYCPAFRRVTRRKSSSSSASSIFRIARLSVTKRKAILIFMPPLLLPKEKTAWTASSCARILNALRQCSITSCCTSWRMFSAPTTSWVGTAFINATASTLSREEDGAINASYAIWRELIAEVIAFEMDDNCFVVPLREKAALLQHYEEEFENGNRKRGISMILCEALTSKECEMSATWNIAQKKIAGHKPFDNPLFMDMLGLVFRKLRDAVICLKSWNRVTGEHPPSCARSSTFPDGETSCPTPFWLMRSATALFMMHTRSSLTVKSPCGSTRA